jgi:hypothetical protein
LRLPKAQFNILTIKKTLGLWLIQAEIPVHRDASR